jgi:hypothetical protein
LDLRLPDISATEVITNELSPAVRHVGFTGGAGTGSATSILEFRCRGAFVYVEAQVPGGTVQPLVRLGYGGSARHWGLTGHYGPRRSSKTDHLATYGSAATIDLRTATNLLADCPFCGLDVIVLGVRKLPNLTSADQRTYLGSAYRPNHAGYVHAR